MFFQVSQIHYRLAGKEQWLRINSLFRHALEAVQKLGFPVYGVHIVVALSCNLRAVGPLIEIKKQQRRAPLPRMSGCQTDSQPVGFR